MVMEAKILAEQKPALTASIRVGVVVQADSCYDVNKKSEATSYAEIPGHKTQMERSVYAKGFGEEDQGFQTRLNNFFGNYGMIRKIRLRREKDKTFKGSVFVEFDDLSSAGAFLDADPKPTWDGKELLIMSNSHVHGPELSVTSASSGLNTTESSRPSTPMGESIAIGRGDDFMRDNPGASFRSDHTGSAGVSHIWDSTEAFEIEKVGNHSDKSEVMIWIVFMLSASISERLKEMISGILKGEVKRQALSSLTGSRAQLVIDYLDIALIQPDRTVSWLRKHMTIILYKLCKANNLYPKCYVLKDVSLPTSPEAGGAFSDIFKGQHKMSKQVLCVKVVRLHKKSEADTMLKVFAKEAVLWRQLRHPCILPFYGVFYRDKECRQVCLVSPWMHNGNLVEYLKNNPKDPRGPLIYDIALALEYMESEHLIHGDLKGVNVLINDARRACIADFGLSLLRTDKTMSFAIPASTIRGCSYRWAAPELIIDTPLEDAQLTLQSDVWAFGCICYEVLSGKLPFPDCGSDVAVITRLLRGGLPAQKPETLTQMEDGLWDLIGHCWKISPSERPSCNEILKVLEKIEGVARVLRDENVQLECYLEHDRVIIQEAAREEDVVDLFEVEQLLIQL